MPDDRVILESENGKAFRSDRGELEIWERAGRCHLFARNLAAEIERLREDNAQLRAYCGNEIFASDYQTAGAMRKRIEHLESEVARLGGGEGE